MHAIRQRHYAIGMQSKREPVHVAQCDLALLRPRHGIGPEAEVPRVEVLAAEHAAHWQADVETVHGFDSSALSHASCAAAALGPGWPAEAGGDMKRLHVATMAIVLATPLAVTAARSAAAPTGAWQSSVPFTNVVASSPTTGGGYPVPPGSRVPLAGTCRQGPFNANHSESWLAVRPGTEDLVGTSKFFFDKYSTFYMFYNGAYQIPGGTPTADNQVQGFDCTSVGTQNM